MISQEQAAAVYSSVASLNQQVTCVTSCNICRRQDKCLCEGCDYKDNIIINKDYYSLYMMFFIPYCCVDCCMGRQEDTYTCIMAVSNRLSFLLADKPS